MAQPWPTKRDDNVPEWLRGLTRNQLGSACTGSNPVVVVLATHSNLHFCTGWSLFCAILGVGRPEKCVLLMKSGVL